MRSTTNTYLSNLDHLRALAAFMVFVWHFTHFSSSCPQQGACTNYYEVKAPFLSLLEQGYTGVALFMCISGYIFTHLIDGKQVHIGTFWLNRILRLFPLIVFWGAIESIGIIGQVFGDNGLTLENLSALAGKLLYPQGAWTIYIECQYYLALPLILFLIRKYGAKALLWTVVALVLSRSYEWHRTGTIQDNAYWTIWGHADQFLLGTAAFYLEKHIKSLGDNGRRYFRQLGLAGFVGIIALYQYMNLAGGFYHMQGNPSQSPLWILIPTIEGVCYSLMIIGYLQCSIPQWLDAPLSALGRWSYSIYLNHFQLLPILYYFGVAHVGMGDGFYSRLMVGTFVVFPILVLPCMLTYTLIEKPFLGLRKNYVLPL